MAGRVALVTGGASGIGRAIVEELAGRGARLIVADIDGDAAAATARELDPERVRAFAVDVAVPADVEAMVAFAVETFGGLHLAVNNAGIGGAACPIGAYDPDVWRRVMAVDCDGVFHGLRFEIPALIASGGGAIVNMSSIFGTLGAPGMAAYTAAKHAVIGLTKVAALEYAQAGVRVNAVGPAIVETPLIVQALGGAIPPELAQGHPIGRLGQPAEIASLVGFLLSDRASFLTGGYYLADGGYTAQ